MGDIRGGDPDTVGDTREEHERAPERDAPQKRRRARRRARHWTLGRFGRHCFGWILFLGLILGGLAAALETGTLDRALSSGAQSALNAALGPRYSVEIGDTAIRFTRQMRLALVARDVTVHDISAPQAAGSAMSRTGVLRMVLDPVALIEGRVSISEIEAEGIALDATTFASGEPLDLKSLRVDLIPALLEKNFTALDAAAEFLRRSGVDAVHLDAITVAMKGDDGKPLELAVDDLALARDAASGRLDLSGRLAFAGKRSGFKVTAVGSDGRSDSLTASIDAVDVTPFSLKRDSAGEIRQGFTGSMTLDASARRGDAANKPALSLTLTSAGGTFYQDGRPQPVTRLNAVFGYDFLKNTLEIAPSQVEFGPMRVPFTGGVIDLDRLDGAGASGFALDLLVENGWADVPTAGEPPFPFSLKIFGRYRHDDGWLEVSELTARTPSGTLTGTLRVDARDPSPELRFDGHIDSMQVGMVKQLWPYWMAAKPREWVFQNLFGGTIRNASIAVHIPAGRMTVEPRPLELGHGELSIAFDVENTRMNIAGEIPPLRDTRGRLQLDGPELKVTIDKGVSYFPSGRSVSLEAGEVDVASTYHKPLMADVKATVSGDAAAIAELASFRPIHALQRTGFEISDFSGTATVEAGLRIGLVEAQNPPPPEWHASVDLQDVGLAKPLDGHKIGDLDGKLDLDPKAARLQGSAKIDGAQADIKLTEPLGENSGVARERSIKVKLDNKLLTQLAPALEGVMDGSADVEIKRIDDNRQSLRADLGQATLTVPFVGWTKGKGVAAQLKLTINTNGSDTKIEDLDLAGDGFGASGGLSLSKGALVAAELSRVKLSPADDFAVSAKPGKNGLKIDVTGKAADLRSIIGRLKSAETAPKGKGGGSGGGFSGSLEAKLDRAIGFNDEVISAVTLNYGAKAGRTDRIDLAAVTDAGQAVVAQMRRSGKESAVTLTTSDAGSVVRFIDLYNHMQGGLLNMKLDGRDDAPWSGFIDLRNFRVENEQRLQSMVSTPTGDDGRSLNNAVNKDIDVSSAKFQRAFARLVYREGALRVENGILRGEQVGATFQGVVKDEAGNIDMTGTFMPAYGLNRLFAELPVIGILLGNGRDRGLLGITFKLTGQTEKPKLVVNPLSIIAPGVFRQIFEFQ